MSYWARIASRRPLPKERKVMDPVLGQLGHSRHECRARPDHHCGECGYAVCSCRQYACDDCSRTFRTTEAKFKAHDCAGKLDSCAKCDSSPAPWTINDHKLCKSCVEAPYAYNFPPLTDGLGHNAPDPLPLSLMPEPYRSWVQSEHARLDALGGTNSVARGEAPKSVSTAALQYELGTRGTFADKIHELANEMARVSLRNETLFGLKTEWVPGEKEHTLVAKTSPIAAPKQKPLWDIPVVADERVPRDSAFFCMVTKKDK